MGSRPVVRRRPVGIDVVPGVRILDREVRWRGDGCRCWTVVVGSGPVGGGVHAVAVVGPGPLGLPRREPLLEGSPVERPPSSQRGPPLARGVPVVRGAVTLVRGVGPPLLVVPRPVPPVLRVQRGGGVPSGVVRGPRPWRAPPQSVGAPGGRGSHSGVLLEETTVIRLGVVALTPPPPPPRS